MTEGEGQTPVPKEAPAGLFFTKAAFLKYSAFTKVREASAARRHEQPLLPKPLGPLPGPLTRAAQPRAGDGGLAQRSKVAKPAETQDAVVPELHSPDSAASGELASEDIWGDDDADTGVEDESAMVTARDTEEAASVPELAAKHDTRSCTRKRQSAAPAKGEKAPKRPRRQPAKPPGARKSTAAAKPSPRAAPCKSKDAKKAAQSRRRSSGAGSAAAGVSEPKEVSEAPSEMQAAKAEFMRTMGLPEPRAFSSGSRGVGVSAAQTLQPAVAQKRVKTDLAAGGSLQASGKGPPTRVQVHSQPGRRTAEPAPLPQQDTAEGLVLFHQQRPLLKSAFDQCQPEAAVSPDASAELAPRQGPGAAAEPAAIHEAPQEPAASALNVVAPASASPSQGAPQDAATALADKALQSDSPAHHQQAAPDEKPDPGAPLTAVAEASVGMDLDHAADLVAGEATDVQQGSGPVPASPEAPKVAQLLGGSGRPAENGVKLVNLLNPNNSQYNQAFALEYARMRAAAGKDGAKMHRKQGAKRIWSNLTAQDHAWYLAKQGLRLHGRDAERMADLSEKAAEEQQQFIRAQWLDAQDAERFRYMDPRVEAQLQAHYQPLREAARRLPRFWQLHGQLQLAAALQGTKQAPAMAHLSTPASSGQPQAFILPSGHTAVPLDRTYTPQDGVAPSIWLHQDETALQLAAEKRAAVVMADGAFAELAQTAVQGCAAGWEIPITVLPSSSSGDAQAPQSAMVVLSDPLLKRALSRREKHEALFAAAILAMGHDKSLKQQPTLEERLQVQASDWRKQVLQELGAPPGGSPAQEAQGLASAALPQDSAGKEGRITRPEAAEASQPALRYSLWRLGEHRIITRARVHAAMQSSPGTGHSMATVVQAKMEYHGNKASDAEEVTAEELVRWWSAAHIRPGAHVLVGHVGVHSCQVLRSQHFTAPELLESAAGAGFRPAMAWRLLSAVLGQLTSLPPGQYLLTHQPGSDAICLFAAAAEAELASEADVPPLPCMTDAPRGTVFDLWSAHANSGAIDESQLGFIPKMWQPSFPDMPQIPYTFTPRQNPNAKRRGRKGNPKGTAAGAGHILDWDTKPQKAAGNDTNFSAAKYAELLQEDI